MHLETQISHSILFIQVCFGDLCSFKPSPKFWDLFSVSVKNGAGIFIRIALRLQITLGRTVIFTIFILPIHQHERSFHFLVFFSVFSLVPFFVWLLRMGLLSWSSLSLVYEKPTDFCMLILHPATSMPFWALKGFWVESFGVSDIKKHFFWKGGTHHFFSYLYPFYLLPL